MPRKCVKDLSSVCCLNCQQPCNIIIAALDHLASLIFLNVKLISLAPSQWYQHEGFSVV